MKIPTRHSFIVLILLMEACLLIKGEKCWIPMLCDDQPTWRELTKGHCTKEDEKTLDALTERLDGMKSGLNQLKKVMEKSETNSVPPSVIGVTTTSQGNKVKKTSLARTSNVPATSPWSTKEVFLSTVRPQTTKGEQSTENEATTEDMTSVIVTTQGLSTEECGLFYNSKCFRAIVYKARNVSLSVAETLCGNKMANIYDVTHYNLVLDYLRSMIPDGRSWIWIRAGMTYKNGQLYSTTGQAMSLSAQVWRENYPNSDASYTTVVVDVNQDSKDEDQGIYNTPTSNVYHGAICEN
uniref:uncharacterized protein LOC120329604 n=1 Tax=Styela clava TaxID=7725 RepID=UPI00193A6A88|nr:uncharacterized protein LOC120329604 [Styela clava]